MFFHLVIGHFYWIFIQDAYGAVEDSILGSQDSLAGAQVTANSNTKIQYVLFTSKMDWHSARLACKGIDGYLATIETDGQLDMVKRFINDKDIWGESWDHSWIGLHESGSSLVIDDDQCTDVGNDAIVKYSKIEEKCYRIKDNKLDRSNCRESNQFLCQRYIADNIPSALVIPGNTENPEPCSIRAETLNTKTQYILFTTKMDWHTARLVCKGIDGYLATIKERQLNAIKMWSTDKNIWKGRWDHSWTGLHIESGTTKVPVFDDYNCSPFDENTLQATAGKSCYRVNKNNPHLEENKCEDSNSFICQRYIAESTGNFSIAIVMGRDNQGANGETALTCIQILFSSIDLEQICPHRDSSPVYTTTLTEHQYVTVSEPIRFVSVTTTATVTATMTTSVVSTHTEVINIAAPTVTRSGGVLTTTVRETSCITSTNVLTTQPMSTVIVTSMAACASLEPVHVTITTSEVNSCLESTVTLPAEVLTTTVIDMSCIASTNVLMSTVLVTSMASCSSLEPVHMTITASEVISCLESTVTLPAEVLTTTVLDTSCIASTNVLTTQPMSTVFVTSMATCSSVQPITHVSTVENPCSFPVTQNYIRVEKNKTTICRTYNNTVPDVTEVKEAVASIVSELTVQTKNLSKTVRAKTSTPDRRFSSQSIGLTSVCIVFMPFAVIVLLDVTTIVREMRTSFLNVKGHGSP